MNRLTPVTTTENEWFFKGTPSSHEKTRFNLGIGMMRAILSEVARRLGLPNPDSYTGTNIMIFFFQIVNMSFETKIYVAE